MFLFLYQISSHLEENKYVHITKPTLLKYTTCLFKNIAQLIIIDF
jgi:hypothetical protein